MCVFKLCILLTLSHTCFLYKRSQTQFYPHGKNGFVTAAELGTTNKLFVNATKNFAAATKRFLNRTKHFVVTKYVSSLFKQMILLV